MKIEAAEFLRAHHDCWITRRTVEYAVVNVHVADVAAPPERVFAALSSRAEIAPGWHWRALFLLRTALGKLFGWDPGLRWHGPEPLVPGNHYAFFRIEHVDPPRELGLSVENNLTRALMSYIIVPVPAPSLPARVPPDAESRLYNVTCAVFKGRLGRAYWRVIRPFHDALTEDMLASIRRHAETPERRGNS